MENPRLHIGVVFGGMSAEHEVSWQSARNVIKAIDPKKYLPIPILINKQGTWFRLESDELYSNDLLSAPPDPKPLPPDRRVLLEPDDGKLYLFQRDSGTRTHSLDAIFPVVHGPYGEDGTLQGLCKLYQIPFVGAGVLSSAVCMDKEITRRLLKEQNIPGANFFTVTRTQGQQNLSEAIELLGFPLFVKPANLGSSVGVSKVNSLEELEKALSHVWQFDFKAIIEEYIKGREIECSVLGNEDPIASIPGEIIPQAEFYSYQAKYLDPEGAILKIPADLPQDVITKIQNMAIRSFLALGGEGMARVDFFLCPDGSILVNELNTIPGFTDISMYPKLWEASGLPCRELVHRLIQLAMDRSKQEAMNSCNWDEVPAQAD